MPEFNIKYIDKDGSVKEFTGEYDSQLEALNTHISMGVTPISIRKKSSFDPNNVVLVKKVSKDKVADLFQDLADSIKAGSTLVEGTEEVLKHLKTSYFKEIVSEINDDIKKGVPLSDAFAKHPTVFDESTIALVSSGEDSGTVAEVLEHLVMRYRKSGDFMKSLLTSMIYPSIILIFSIFVVYIIVAILLPNMEGMYEQLDGELPYLTLVVVDFSNFIRDQFILLCISLLSIVAGFIVFLKIERTRYWFDTLLLYIPFIGGWVKTYETHRITYILASLIDGGVSMDKSLDIVSRAIKNRCVAKGVMQVKDEVEKGGVPLSEAFKDTRGILPVFLQNISVGEKTGTITDRLERLEKRLDRNLDKYTNSVKKTLSPALVVVLSIPVGILLFATISPIYKMMEYV